jgi:hypothetical protein
MEGRTAVRLEMFIVFKNNQDKMARQKALLQSREGLILFLFLLRIKTMRTLKFYEKCITYTVRIVLHTPFIPLSRGE